MKTIKLGFVALIFTLGLGAAFATNAKHHKQLDNPNWQTTDASGNIVSTSTGGVYDANRTLSEAQSDYGCAGSADFCAVTVTGENGSKTDDPLFINKN